MKATTIKKKITLLISVPVCVLSKCQLQIRRANYLMLGKSSKTFNPQIVFCPSKRLKVWAKTTQFNKNLSFKMILLRYQILLFLAKWQITLLRNRNRCYNKIKQVARKILILKTPTSFNNKKIRAQRRLRKLRTEILFLFKIKSLQIFYTARQNKK